MFRYGYNTSIHGDQNPVASVATTLHFPAYQVRHTCNAFAYFVQICMFVYMDIWLCTDAAGFSRVKFKIGSSHAKKIAKVCGITSPQPKTLIQEQLRDLDLSENLLNYKFASNVGA